MTVEVWTAGTPDLPDRSELLSPGELLRARRLLLPDHRRDFIAAHALLRLALSSRLDLPPRALELEAEPKGRPFLAPHQQPPHPVHLSLSHTAGRVAVALSGVAPIGVDIEPLGRLEEDPTGFAHRHFHPGEAAEIAAASRHEAPRLAISLWCLKEALGKATGEGLRLSARSSRFMLSPGGQVTDFRMERPADGDAWHFALHEIAGSHVLALASTGEIGAAVPLDGEPLLARRA